MLHFTIYTRSYCHLCEDMRAALLVELGAHAETLATIAMVDVDADPALLAAYDELVPVLMGQQDDQAALQLCHYFLDKERLRRFLAA